METISVDLFVLVVVVSLIVVVVVGWVLGFIRLVNAMLATIQEDGDGNDYLE